MPAADLPYRRAAANGDRTMNHPMAPAGPPPPARKPSARFLLRAATADFHARVDRVFSRANLASRADYAQFLLAQAAAHMPVEAALTRAGAAALIPDWPVRLRADALRHDLAALNLDPPPPAGEIAFAGAPAVLGGAYVLEGSRLGGALLRRSVPPEFPADFLAAGDPAAWRAFLVTLDEHIQTPEEVAAATVAASEVFTLFERSGQRFF